MPQAGACARNLRETINGSCLPTWRKGQGLSVQNVLETGRPTVRITEPLLFLGRLLLYVTEKPGVHAATKRSTMRQMLWLRAGVCLELPNPGVYKAENFLLAVAYPRYALPHLLA